MRALIIDNDIPVPVEISWKAKLDALQVGQSTKVLIGSENTVRQVASSEFHRIKGGKRFTTKIDPTDSANYRVWRIK